MWRQNYRMGGSFPYTPSSYAQHMYKPVEQNCIESSICITSIAYKLKTKITEHTSRRHCRKIPPLDIFFSASSSPKFKELAKIRTSAMLTNRCRNDTATSIGMPWVGSMTSSSLYKKDKWILILSATEVQLK